MADKLVDMKKLVARYETNAFGALSRQDKANLAEDVDAALETEATGIKMNAVPVEARYLPRLADIQQNVYSVLESESRKLADASLRRYHETLSAEEVKLLGVVTNQLQYGCLKVAQMCKCRGPTAGRLCMMHVAKATLRWRSCF